MSLFTWSGTFCFYFLSNPVTGNSIIIIVFKLQLFFPGDGICLLMKYHFQVQEPVIVCAHSVALAQDVNIATPQCLPYKV